MAAEDKVPGSDWSGNEIDLVVAAYFTMLNDELAGLSINKAQHNRALQKVVARSRGSLEFKHQNISAVLARLGYPWIVGYKPLANYQGALVDGVERYLDRRGGLLDLPDGGLQAPKAQQIIFESAPKFEPTDPSTDAPLRRLIAKFDPAERDARNRALGKTGEERVFQHEVGALMAAGRKDLASKVVWTAEEVGDGAGYDIRSFWPSGKERLLEVKTTLGHKSTPFFLTSNEVAASEEYRDIYRVVRVYDFARHTRAFELASPLEAHLVLWPTVYRASFR